MILNRRGNILRRAIHAIVSIALRLFFRRIETVGADLVPFEKPVIFVMNHPNGLIDPALVFVALPRKISFLAKSTLFTIPVLGSILRLVEALPVYRKIDAADVSKNQDTFRACHDLLVKDGAIALFPEGISHNSPKLLPIKTGAARIALGALHEGTSDETVTFCPVGLYYTSKTTFRSEALLQFGKPFVIRHPGREVDREEVQDVTTKIEEGLREVTINAETSTQVEEASLGANLFASLSETLDFEEPVSEKFEFIRDYVEIAERPESASLRERVSAYKKNLRSLGLEPENLSLSNTPRWYVFRRFLLRAFVLIALLPLIILGTIIHFIPYQVSKLLARRYTNHGVDDIISTVKILSGIVLMPVTWIILTVLLIAFTGSLLALIVLPFSFLVGYVTLRSWEEFEELRGWLRIAKVFYMKRSVLLELLDERTRIANEFEQMTNSLD